MAAALYIVDAFTDRSFAGNPAAVCLLERPGEDVWMQQLAAEMNQSETAFLWPEGDAHRLRWFTPTREVDLCGHATLASAHVLWQTGRKPVDHPLEFHTRSGLLTAVRLSSDERAARPDREPPGSFLALDSAPLIGLDFPSLPPRPCRAEEGLLEALGLAGAERYVAKAGSYQMVEVDNEKTLRAIRPDMRRLAGLAVLGVIVTCEPDASEQRGEVDFVSRFFAPAGGIEEDPVTGSAHCVLGPFWGARLHKTDLVGHQASQRGGQVRVSLRGQRVLLGGQAVTLMRGELAVPPQYAAT